MGTKPKLIEVGEWEYKGFVIQAQSHPKLKPFCVFPKILPHNHSPQGFFTFKEAIAWINDHQKINEV